MPGAKRSSLWTSRPMFHLNKGFYLTDRGKLSVRANNISAGPQLTESGGKEQRQASSPLPVPNMQFQLIYLPVTDENLGWQMQNERAPCTDWVPEHLACPIHDINSAGTLQFNNHVRSTSWTAQRNEEQYQKGNSKESGLVCIEVMSKLVLHVIKCQSRASQERLCKYLPLL